MTATLFSRLRRWYHKSARPVREVYLSLETLEKRALPSAVAASPVHPPLNDTYLATVYQGELHRAIDPAGLAYWRGQLQQSDSRTQAAQGILGSNEYFNDQIWSDYGALLGRAPDAGGWANYMHALQNGATPQDVQASIMGSDEFFSRVGGDPTSFLNAVYGEVLNRPVDGQGLAFWAPLTGAVAGRTEAVRAIEASPEASELTVTTIYQDTLGRTPDAGGLSYWSGQLESGASQTTVLAGVLGSDEFFSRMQSYVSNYPTTDPNMAAAHFITNAQLFQSPPRVVLAAPVTNPVVPSGDNSGFDTPSGDNSGFDNSGNLGAIDTSVIDTTGMIDTSVGATPVVIDTSSSDTSGDSGVIDTSGGDNCGCDNSTPDYSNSYDTSSPDTSGGSDATSSWDGSDPSAGF
jgi:hypothetical protein